jgi:hypothetical protein
MPLFPRHSEPVTASPVWESVLRPEGLRTNGLPRNDGSAECVEFEGAL